MANTFLTMKNVAREALPTLVNNLLMPNLVHQDYSKDFVGKGDTIQIKKPPIYTANDFSGTIAVQDTAFSKVEITMDRLADVSVEVTSKELALDMEDFKVQVIEPMAAAIAEKINNEGLSLVKDIPYYSGSAGTTPSSLADFAEIRKGLTNNKAPKMMRRAIWDTEADYNFAQLDSLVKVNESGSNDALREGEIGRTFGLDNYSSQSVYVHEAGNATAASAPKMNGAATVDDTTISIDASTMTGTLVAGDLLAIGGNTYVVTQDTAAASSNAIADVVISPAVVEDIADNADIVFADATARASVRNVGFHPKAFAFVSRSLPMPSDADGYVVSCSGLTLRVVRSYDITTKKEIMSMDVLYGFKTIYPELAHVRLG